MFCAGAGSWHFTDSWESKWGQERGKSSSAYNTRSQGLRPPSLPPIRVSLLLSLARLISVFVLAGFPWWLRGLRIHLQCKRHGRHGFNPWIRKILWRKQWQPTPVVLPGEFHGKRSLGGFIQSMGSQRVRHSWVTERAHTLSHNSGGQGMYLIMSLILPTKVSTSLDTGVNEKQTVTARI